MPKPAVSGMETFDHLTDKAQRFLLAMDGERARLLDLKKEVEQERQNREALLARRAELTSVIDKMEERRESFDEKVTTLIEALREVPIRKA